jgi:hypothetical protein
MKKLLFLAICFLGMSLSAFAQKESDKTLVKTLDPTGATSIAYLFKNGGIIAVATPNINMRVELEIHANMDETTLQKLIAAGRYTLEGKMEDGAFNIYAPNLEKRVTVSGTDLEEKIIINVKMPPNYLFDKEKGTIVRDVTDFVQRGESAEKIANMRIFEQLKFEEVKIKLVKIPSKAPKKSSSKDSKGKTSTSEKKADSSSAPANSKTQSNGDKDKKHGDILIDNVPIEGY